MAAILAFRIAILLTPAVVAGYRVVQGPGAAKIEALHRPFLRRLEDPDEDDDSLTLAARDDLGDGFRVTTYAEPFEVRRFQVSWTIGNATLIGEDVRVCTIHLLKAPGGVPTATWDASDYTAAKTAIYALWNGVRNNYPTALALASIKAYREGPAIVPPQPPVFAEEAAAITGSDASMIALPAQVAVSITERTAIRKSWGRIYFPAPSPSAAAGMSGPFLDAVGRMSDSACGYFADKFDTMYEAFKTAGLVPVVYRKPLPDRFSAEAQRQNAEEPDIPARVGSALSVDKLQVDNILDVIRSRRFDKPTLRVLRDIG